MPPSALKQVGAGGREGTVYRHEDAEEDGAHGRLKYTRCKLARDATLH